MFSTLKRIGLKASVYKFFARLFPDDKNVLGACARIGAYRYLQKYRYVLEQQETTDRPAEVKPNRIWLCWLQGYEQAPLVVQKCRDSVVEHHPDMEVTIVDHTNVNQFVTLPDYIHQKHASGIIPNAHYADVIRVCLLEKYGGTWIDATVYMTDRLPDYIVNSDLFCYKMMPLGYCTASNWFISATPNNPIIRQTKALLLEYWRKENKLVSYSIFHLFWTMVVTFNDANKALWHDVPYFDDANCKILRWELFDPFSQERFDQIKRITPIHKLTYKSDKQNTLLDNTFYKYLLQ